VRRIDAPVVRIKAIRGAPSPTCRWRPNAIPPARALISLREALALPFGFEIELDKGIPLGSGLGGSAASCVAALVAANALLDAPLIARGAVSARAGRRSVASGGRHGDNVGPMLLGGLVLATADRLTKIAGAGRVACGGGASACGAGNAPRARRTRRQLCAEGIRGAERATWRRCCWAAARRCRAGPRRPATTCWSSRVARR
jgi:hypothetical protein